MSRYWSRQLHGLSAYQAGEQPRDRSYIKLNTNENPYPPAPRVIDKIHGFSAHELRLYPDPQSARLRRTIADYYGLQIDQVFVGNGSDEVLAHAFMALFRQIYPICFPDISYSFYPVYCGYFGIEYQQIPLTGSFDIDTGHFPPTNGGIIFPNPNAPTGKFTDPAQIQSLLRRNSESAVIIDEAYIDFGGASCIPLISSFPNLLIIQTLSKSRSLAGLRVGYALGDPGLITGLEIAKNSFNCYPLDRIAASAAIEAFLDDDYFQQCRQRIIRTRAWTADRLAGLNFEVVPSSANFMLARHRELPGRSLYQQLKQRGILVRHFDAPRISDYVRISIGTDAEMETLIRTLEEILA
jgi:histidinol-phosphate aminotransferase